MIRRFRRWLANLIAPASVEPHPWCGTEEGVTFHLEYLGEPHGPPGLGDELWGIHGIAVLPGNLIGYIDNGFVLDVPSAGMMWFENVYDTYDDAFEQVVFQGVTEGRPTRAPYLRIISGEDN